MHTATATATSTPMPNATRILLTRPCTQKAIDIGELIVRWWISMGKRDRQTNRSEQKLVRWAWTRHQRISFNQNTVSCKQCIIRCSGKGIDGQCLRITMSLVIWLAENLSLAFICMEFSIDFHWHSDAFFCSSAHIMLCLHSFPPYLFWITVANDYFLIFFMSVFIFEFNMNCKSCCLILMRLLKWIYHDIYIQCVRFVLHRAYIQRSRGKKHPKK